MPVKIYSTTYRDCDDLRCTIYRAVALRQLPNLVLRHTYKSSPWGVMGGDTLGVLSPSFNPLLCTISSLCRGLLHRFGDCGNHIDYTWPTEQSCNSIVARSGWRSIHTIHSYTYHLTRLAQRRWRALALPDYPLWSMARGDINALGSSRQADFTCADRQHSNSRSDR